MNHCRWLVAVRLIQWLLQRQQQWSQRRRSASNCSCPLARTKLSTKLVVAWIVGVWSWKEVGVASSSHFQICFCSNFSSNAFNADGQFRLPTSMLYVILLPYSTCPPSVCRVVQTCTPTIQSTGKVLGEQQCCQDWSRTQTRRHVN